MRRLVGICLILLLPILLIAVIGFTAPLVAIVTLVFGWTMYLARVIPQVSVSGPGVLTALFCLAAFTAGLHAFLQWLCRQNNSDFGEIGTPVARMWSFRWTMGLVALIVLMFVAGLAAVGVTHQVGWLIASPDRILNESGLRQAAKRAKSLNDIRSLARALQEYHDHYQTFPAGGTFDNQGRALHGWMTAILPYLEQKPLYQTIDLAKPWDHPDNRQPFQTVVAGFLSPNGVGKQDDRGYALAHYAANGRVLGGDMPLRLDMITDGAANTLLLGEAAGNFKPWGSPTNWRDPALGLNRTPDGFGTPGRPGTIFAFADGSARVLSNATDPEVLRALSTPAGGEPLPPDF